MSFIYTFSKLVKLGEPDPKYGVTYWAEPNEQVTPVKFNSMNQDIKDSDTIEAEEVLLKTSTKTGNDYHQLKKVKVITPDSMRVAKPALEAMRNAPSTQSQLDRIEAKLDRVLSFTEIQTLAPIDPNDADITSVPDFLRTEDI